MRVDSTRRKSLIRWQKRAAMWEHGFESRWGPDFSGRGEDTDKAFGAAIADVLGTAPVLPAALYVALQRASPGVVVRTGRVGRTVFRRPGGPSQHH
jgi:hypothetical protein